jgi:uncharacterized protein (TIGR03067 family)
MFAGANFRENNMRTIVSVTLGSLFAIGIVTAGDDAKADLKRLQGTWQVVSATSKGEKVPAEDIAELELVIDGDKISVREKGKVQERMMFKIDPAKRPRAIDFTHTDGPKKDKVDHAIYQLDGDNLKICVNEESGGARPTAFASSAGSSHSLIVLKRAK